MTASLSATADDGTHLHGTEWGTRGKRPTILCLPGLTRNGRDFAVLAEALSGGPDARHVIALDFRGRGRSGRAPCETYTVRQELSDLSAAMTAWGVERAQFVGTSRGGLLTMALAMTAPERVDRAVLNDIGPVIDHRGLSRIGQSVGAKMAYASFDALAETLRDGLGPQFPRLTPKHWRRFAEQVASPAADGAGVTMDYDAALGETFRGAHEGPLPDLWPAFHALAPRPVMVLRGAHSDLLSAATVEAMRRCHPGLTTVVVAGEGHAPLLWDQGTIERIRSFLAA